MSASCVETAGLEVTAGIIETLISTGGYTHPLFNPAPDQLEAGARVPLPGPGLLLLAGGLVEQSGALAAAVAMVELRGVRFHVMVHSGDSLRVRVTPGDWRRTRHGKVVQDFEWRVLDRAGDTVAEAVAVMLMDREMEAR
jgi:hypothetical protein